MSSEATVARKRQPAPKGLSISSQQRIVMSKRHALRMASGRMESRPSDFTLLGGEDGKRLLAARLRLEDMRIAKELGLEVEA